MKNSSVVNGRLHEQISLGLIASSGQAYFSENSSLIITSQNDIDEHLDTYEIDKDEIFAMFIGKVVEQGWFSQWHTKLKERKIYPDFCRRNQLFELKSQNKQGSVRNKIYKNLIDFQSFDKESYIVYHGKAFDKKFLKEINESQESLKNPNKTKVLSFNQFVNEHIGLTEKFSGRKVSIAIDTQLTHQMRKKHHKLENYIARVIFDTDTKEVIKTFQTLPVWQCKGVFDGFDNNVFFKKQVFEFDE